MPNAEINYATVLNELMSTVYITQVSVLNQYKKKEL